MPFLLYKTVRLPVEYYRNIRILPVESGESDVDDFIMVTVFDVSTKINILFTFSISNIHHQRRKKRVIYCQ